MHRVDAAVAIMLVTQIHQLGLVGIAGISAYLIMIDLEARIVVKIVRAIIAVPKMLERTPCAILHLGRIACDVAETAARYIR